MRTVLAHDRTVVRLEHGAIRITAEDPEERALVVNARKVLDHAAHLLNSPGVTLREARFTAIELARSLRDMLDLVDPAGVEEDHV